MLAPKLGCYFWGGWKWIFPVVVALFFLGGGRRKIGGPTVILIWGDCWDCGGNCVGDCWSDFFGGEGC